MILRLLNDVKEGHYFWMRKKNEEDIARIGNFGVMFLTLLIYYGSLFLIVGEIVFKYTGKRYIGTSMLTNVLLIFGPYLAVYFLLVYPSLNRGKINEDISEFEKKRKKKIATIYFIFCVLAIPISGIIINTLNGH